MKIITWGQYKNASGLKADGQMHQSLDLLAGMGFVYLNEHFKPSFSNMSVIEKVNEVVGKRDFNLVIYDTKLKKTFGNKNAYWIWIVAKKD